MVNLRAGGIKIWGLLCQKGFLSTSSLLLLSVLWDGGGWGGMGRVVWKVIWCAHAAKLLTQVKCHLKRCLRLVDWHRAQCRAVQVGPNSGIRDNLFNRTNRQKHGIICQDFSLKCVAESAKTSDALFFQWQLWPPYLGWYGWNDTGCTIFAKHAKYDKRVEGCKGNIRLCKA